MIIVFTGTLQTWLLVQSQNIASQSRWESSALRGSSSCKQEVTATSKVSAELWAFEEKLLTDSVFPEISGTHAYIFCPCNVLRCSWTWFPSTGRYSPGKFPRVKRPPPPSCTLEAAATYIEYEKTNCGDIWLPCSNVHCVKLSDVTSVGVQSKCKENRANASLPKCWLYLPQHLISDWLECGLLCLGAQPVEVFYPHTMRNSIFSIDQAGSVPSRGRQPSIWDKKMKLRWNHMKRHSATNNYYIVEF